jgi:hypothetical protein
MEMEYGVMQNLEIVFTLNTNRNYFIDWLAEKTFYVAHPEYKKLLKKATPDGKFSSTLKFVGIDSEETQQIIIDKIQGITGKVLFEIVTIGENRIEVSSKFTENAFVPFSKILLEIAKTYSEAANVIVHYLENKLSTNTADIKIKSVLFLSAEPTDSSQLRLGEEFREIQEKLQLARLRDRFQLAQRMSVRPEDLSQALLDTQPQIVHFSGHGMVSGALCFENQSGKSHPIQPEALAALFEQFTNQVSCVLLNACYSEKQANAIAQHIDYVIGMNQAIGDKAAIAFAIGFYQALGAGRTIEEAYELGRVQIRLQNIPEHLTPVLLKKGQMIQP